MLELITHNIVLGYELSFLPGHVYNHIRVVVVKIHEGAKYQSDQMIPYDHLHEEKIKDLIRFMTMQIENQIKADLDQIDSVDRQELIDRTDG